MTRNEFDKALRALRGQYEAQVDNHGCVECSDCRACAGCTFCKRSDKLVGCHYCVDCARCSDCTHCHEGDDLRSCTHCRGCQHCADSAYLEQCFDCTDCSYCFGCVGLSGQQFHILNEPYERRDYFQLTAKLTAKSGATPQRR